MSVDDLLAGQERKLEDLQRSEDWMTAPEPSSSVGSSPSVRVRCRCSRNSICRIACPSEAHCTAACTCLKTKCQNGKLQELKGNIRVFCRNAEENEYEGVEPELQFVMTEKDITVTGAPATLLIFNNEVGFSRENMECICGIYKSTKKGRLQQTARWILHRGLNLRSVKYYQVELLIPTLLARIGFKSAFLVSSQPHIFSNGYHVRFQQEPDQDCGGVGYIVPQGSVDICLLKAYLMYIGSVLTSLQQQLSFH